jgi:hypothetical protein
MSELTDLAQKVGELDGRLQGMEDKVNETHDDVKLLLGDQNKRKGYQLAFGAAGGAVAWVFSLAIRAFLKGS